LNFKLPVLLVKIYQKRRRKGEMLKKGFLTVLLVAISIFAFSIAQADQIDGLQTNAGPALPATLDVYVNPGGQGDALIYGYYNARGAWNFIRVVNTSTSYGIGAKVRFREGKNSNEVLDFFICLSAGDQWSAWVIGNTNPASPATLYWNDDDTPTYPDPQGDNDATNNLLASVPLVYGIPSSVTADDTKEGYLEIIANNAWLDTPGAAKKVKTPKQCGASVLAIAERPETRTITPEDAPNTLAGNLYIFNAAAAAGTYAYNATPLADFQNVAFDGSLAVDSVPRLSDSEDGLIGVNYVLTKAVEYAIYDIEDWLGGDTTIINTFPTKRLSITQDPGGMANGPFNDDAKILADGRIGDDIARCEDVSVLIWDDAENTPGAVTGFSPSEAVTKKKCDEVNVIVVGTGRSALLNSNLSLFNIDAPAAFQLGWVGIDLTGVGRSTTLDKVTTYGLPVISYELQGVLDGYLTHMLPLRYDTIIGR
jgi:hypothetical protein